MKNNSDELKLVNAALRDESWESCQARLRTQGLASLRASKRSRTRLIWSGRVFALMIIFAAAWWNLSPRSRFSSSNEARGVFQSQLQNSPENATYITEEQMLAM